MPQLTKHRRACRKETLFEDKADKQKEQDNEDNAMTEQKEDSEAEVISTA